MRVCVHGLGTVGLPAGLLLAAEYDVVGVDTDEAVVDTLRAGAVPTDEPGVADRFEAVRASFEARHEPVPAAVHLVAVPTPLDRTTSVADLGHVRSALAAIGEVVRDGDTVAVVSTVPPGTTERLVTPSLPTGTGVAYCPERAIPGRTLAEMRSNDRIVGVFDPATGDRVAALFAALTDGEIRRTDPTTAEFVKLMENTQRDVDVAVANEFALLAEAAGVDVHRARELANRHPRVEVLRPGPGVGGHCITVDPWFLDGAAATTTRLLPAARTVNDTMPDHVHALVRSMLNGRPDARVAVLGAAYKGGVGDTRETPARRLCRCLENDGYRVAVTDPHVDAFEWTPVGLEAAVEGADCLVVVTDHDAFRDLDPERVGDLVASRRVVDARNLLDHDAWRAAGFEVCVLGDGTSRAADPGVRRDETAGLDPVANGGAGDAGAPTDAADSGDEP